MTTVPADAVAAMLAAPAAAADIPAGGPRPPLYLVEWVDATNIATWEHLDGIAGWAQETGKSWVVASVGYLVYEDTDCVVVAARLAWDAEPRQCGLFERIPRRAVTAMRRLLDPTGTDPDPRQCGGY